MANDKTQPNSNDRAVQTGPEPEVRQVQQSHARTAALPGQRVASGRRPILHLKERGDKVD